MRPSARYRAIVASERTTRRFYGVRSWTLVAIASDIDYTELRRQRREQRRRQIRRRRLTAFGVLALLAAAALFGLTRLVSGSAGAATVVLAPVRSAVPPSPFRA